MESALRADGWIKKEIAIKYVIAHPQRTNRKRNQKKGTIKRRLMDELLMVKVKIAKTGNEKFILNRNNYTHYLINDKFTIF